MARKKSLGLVLSGGGYRGAAHAGVLQALAENNIRPDYISGTSAGAIVGALYASGCSVTHILEFWEKENLFQFSYFTFGKPGLVDTDKMTTALKKYIGADTFEDLNIKLFVAATNIITGRTKFFKDGPLIRPVIASASFPLIFTPTEFEGEYYLDGGIINNFPLEPIKLFCDVSLGVNISPMRRNLNIKDLDGYMEVVQRVYELGSDADTQGKMILCDFCISPDELNEYGTFDRGNIEKMFEIGYDHAMKIMPELRQKLK